MSLETLISRFRDQIERTLHEVLASENLHDEDYLRMLHYHMGWRDAEADADQYMGSSGKRTRPLITLLCTAASGGEWHLALPFAAGLELVHNFSLIHDDIQDSSLVRRSRPTVWALWGQNKAINAGDAMLAYAHLAMQGANGLPEKTRLEALQILDETCIALTQGQHLDMTFEDQDVVTVEEYMTMISGKTATLIATAAELGALASGAPDEVRRSYRAFGHYLGLAFQIRDDLLGIWGDALSTGKSTTMDIESGKKTLPILHGLLHSPELRQAYRDENKGRADAHAIRAILEAIGTRGYAEGEESRHINQALGCLNQAEPTGEAGAALRKMTLQLLGREN